VGTVYRHFPSLDELVPACGEITRHVLALPDPRSAASLFDGLDALPERIERLVGEVYAIYERGAPQLRAIRDEPDVHPNVAEAGDEVEAAIAALIEAAVESSAVTPADRAVVRAMVDLNTWAALRGQGLDRAKAVATVAEMLSARLIQ
jgi:AcrR family transcriptional regulator